MKIKMDHVARTEGHMGFVSHILNGNIDKAKLETLEGARMFEGILVGRQYSEVGEITQRICGVCPVIHGIVAIKAVENAMGVKVSEKTVLLRKMMLLGQIIQSHTLHLYFLSLPDFLDFQDDLKMVAKYPDRSKRILQLRDFGNKIIAQIGGRTVHPISPRVGGFTKYPEWASLNRLAKKTKEMLPVAQELAELFNKLTYPDFQRETEFIALQKEDEYAIYGGDVVSSEGYRVPAKNFLKNVEELEKPFQLVKNPQHKGQPYLVNALSRLHLNHQLLQPAAQKLLDKSKIDFPDFNTFHNVIAQAIEVVHCLEEFNRLVAQYAKVKDSTSSVDVKVKAGRGVGAGEAPRGTLYHEYEFDELGQVTHCNIIAPTTQFLFNIEQDLNKYLPQLKEKKLATQKKEIRKLIRAYDPCISCATH
ncbi:Ni/Fe hydrogenase subunit alpha [Patescibacteria group bacterium]